MELELYFDQTPILGWRAWALAEGDGGAELTSVVYRHPWPAGAPMTGRCEPGGCPAARWPAQPHACGIHAFKRREDAAAFPASWERLRFDPSPQPDEYVLGRVSLWGHVVEHERGYRAGLAYPYELVLSPGQARFAAELASSYVVDVVVERAPVG